MEKEIRQKEVVKTIRCRPKILKNLASFVAFWLEKPCHDLRVQIPLGKNKPRFSHNRDISKSVFDSLSRSPGNLTLIFQIISYSGVSCGCVRVKPLDLLMLGAD